MSEDGKNGSFEPSLAAFGPFASNAPEKAHFAIAKRVKKTGENQLFDSRSVWDT